MINLSYVALGPGLSWEYLRMPTLEEHLTTVYAQPIGTGGSGRLNTHPHGYSREEYIKALDGLVSYLGVSRVHLLGHSHGGFVTQYYALKQADRLAGIILYESAPALIAFVKDTLIYLVILVAIIYIPYKLGGWHKVWPPTYLAITAVDARTGEPRVFDRDSGGGLVEPVAASAAVPMVWPPVTIDDHSSIGGGMRSSVNADLPADHARILILAPAPDPQLDDQITRLKQTARVEVIVPDAAPVAARGTNPLDPAVCASSGRAGCDHGRTAATVRALWRNDGRRGLTARTPARGLSRVGFALTGALR
jgi:pimeloyl-ACP methyl ester carboxylesterase